MESNLNQDKINAYSVAFSQTICNSFFFTPNKKINGKDILSLTPVKQVNLFVLKVLFDLWDKESDKLKSKYFNYENDEVKDALKNFLNTLSQHIWINRTDFEPLLKEATADTLQIILSPYEYYRKVFRGFRNSISVDHLKNVSKYVQINKHLLTDLIRKVESRSLSEFDIHTCIALFDEVCEQSQASPEDVDVHLRTFGIVREVNIDDFYSNETPSEPKRETDFPFEKREIPNTIDPPEAKRILAETFIVDKPTLNEKFGGENRTTLAEKLQNSKIQSIKSSIPINQKFLYINELFNGNIQDFASTVDELDECKSLGEAKELVVSKFAPRYNWNKDGDTYKDFLQTVERKYI